MLTEYELEQQFDEMLDECYEMINICGLEYDPSIAFKRVDLVAYRQAFLDYYNNLKTDEESE